MTVSTDRDLIESTVRGDHRAFALLVDRYGRSVYARIARHVPDPDDVDDLVQEVFLTVYTSLAQIRQRDRFPAWLTTITENQVRMWWRRRYVQRGWEAMVQSVEEREPQDAHDEETSQELLSMLRHAVRRLSEAHRQVIVHHYLNGFTYQETASLLGLEVDTVRSRLQKARHRLKEEMHVMHTQGYQSQTFALTREDLTALRWATRFASQDPTRPNLHGVYLDIGGRIVATDGHRLLLWPTDTLRMLALPVLVGPWPSHALPEVEQATLVIREQNAVVRAAEMAEYTVPLLDASFPDYERVLPTTWSLQVTVAADSLHEVIGLLTTYLEHLLPQHPVDPEGHFLYRPRHPQVELRISTREQTLALFTTRAMGYFPTAEDSNREPPPTAGPEWTFQAAIPVQIETAGVVDHLRIGVDWAYLCDAIGALGVGPTDTLLVRLLAPDQPMLFSTAARADRQVVLCPMRIITEAPEGTGVDQAQASAG